MKGANLWQTYEKKVSLFHIAARKGHEMTLVVLLCYIEYLTVRDAYYKWKHLKKVHKIKSVKALKNNVSELFATSIYNIYKEDILLQAMQIHRGILLDCLDIEGKGPVHYAAEFKLEDECFDVIKLLFNFQ